MSWLEVFEYWYPFFLVSLQVIAFCMVYTKSRVRRVEAHYIGILGKCGMVSRNIKTGRIEFTEYYYNNVKVLDNSRLNSDLEVFVEVRNG